VGVGKAEARSGSEREQDAARGESGASRRQRGGREMERKTKGEGDQGCCVHGGLR
jgi:hypothetical protein